MNIAGAALLLLLLAGAAPPAEPAPPRPRAVVRLNLVVDGFPPETFSPAVQAIVKGLEEGGLFLVTKDYADPGEYLLSALVRVAAPKSGPASAVVSWSIWGKLADRRLHLVRQLPEEVLLAPPPALAGKLVKHLERECPRIAQALVEVERQREKGMVRRREGWLRRADLRSLRWLPSLRNAGLCQRLDRHVLRVLLGAEV